MFSFVFFSFLPWQIFCQQQGLSQREMYLCDIGVCNKVGWSLAIIFHYIAFLSLIRSLHNLHLISNKNVIYILIVKHFICHSYLITSPLVVCWKSNETVSKTIICQEVFSSNFFQSWLPWVGL